MRAAVAVPLAVLALLASACADPPDKEMNQARGAIEAARAAGADAYAVEEYNAAVRLLERSEDSVRQRDYRQALNYALDSREQALNAARAAATQKAAARSQAERDLRELQRVLEEASARLKAAETSRARRRALAAERQAIERARLSVQEAGAAVGRQDYLAAEERMRGVTDDLRAAIRRIEQPPQPVKAKRRR